MRKLSRKNFSTLFFVRVDRKRDHEHSYQRAPEHSPEPMVDGEPKGDPRQHCWRNGHPFLEGALHGPCVLRFLRGFLDHSGHNHRSPPQDRDLPVAGLQVYIPHEQDPRQRTEKEDKEDKDELQHNGLLSRSGLYGCIISYLYWFVNHCLQYLVCCLYKKI